MDELHREFANIYRIITGNYIPEDTEVILNRLTQRHYIYLDQQDDIEP